MRTIAKDKINRNTDGHDGSYQLLSWYKANGYDEKAIKKNCRDTEEHAVLGTTYRVDIHKVSSEKIENEVEKEVINLMSSKDKKKKASKRSRSSSSSSSSSSSRSRSSKKTKASVPQMTVHQSSMRPTGSRCRPLIVC